jgi:predicted DNA-binding protein with PD1-like motif
MYLAGFAKENNISAAAFTAVGALKNGKLGFYDQKKHVYANLHFRDPSN